MHRSRIESRRARETRRRSSSRDRSRGFARVTYRAGDARSAPRDADQRVPGGHDYDERLCERGVRAAVRRRRRRRRVCARF